MTKRLRRDALALAVTTALLAAAPAARADDAPPPPAIVVNGEAVVQATPDRAFVNVAVETRERVKTAQAVDGIGAGRALQLVNAVVAVDYRQIVLPRSPASARSDFRGEGMGGARCPASCFLVRMRASSCSTLSGVGAASCGAATKKGARIAPDAPFA